MSELLERLPAWARPLERERPGLGSLRLAESTILVLVGVLLASATVNDLVRQVHVNRRLIADVATWRAATGHDYHNLGIEQDFRRHGSEETVCGNVSPGGLRERTQVCLMLGGRVLGGRREVLGGYYVPPKTFDQRRYRYSCFGKARLGGQCALSTPPAGAGPSPPLRLGRP